MKYNPHKVVYPFPFLNYFLKLQQTDYNRKMNSKINFAHNWM